MVVNTGSPRGWFATGWVVFWAEQLCCMNMLQHNCSARSTTQLDIDKRYNKYLQNSTFSSSSPLGWNVFKNSKNISFSVISPLRYFGCFLQLYTPRKSSTYGCGNGKLLCCVCCLLWQSIPKANNNYKTSIVGILLR